MDRSTLVRFGPFSFDPSRMVLKRDGQPVPLGGRATALLSALVEAQGQVVTRGELLDAVWSGQVVEERNLTLQMSALRQAMGELPSGEDPIRTVSRVGYRLVLDGVPPRSDRILALRPTVAVLPFSNLSSDPELAFFADGVTEDLITALSRFRTFAVIERGSSFAYKGRVVPAPEIALALGVRYLLDGSVRREGRRLRINARLSDVGGVLLWADSFEEELGGIFEMQDRITAEVVDLVEPQITRAEVERSRRKNPESMDAYDHFLLGSARLDRLDADAAQYDKMVGHLDRSVELDPDFPHALVQAARAHELRRLFNDSSPPGTDDFAIRNELGKRALTLAPDDAFVLASAAVRIHKYDDDAEGSIALAERAIALSPHSVRVLRFAATILRQRCRAEEAIPFFERCLRLSPNSPQNGFVLENIGCCHLDVGRYEEAIDWIKRALAMGASWDLVLVNLAVAEALSGEMDAARSTLDRFLRVRPGATIRGLMDRLPPGQRRSTEHIWPEGLRRVGLPEA